MRMAKAPQKQIDALRVWLHFNDELCLIDPCNEFEWDRFKQDWIEDQDFGPIIKYCQDERGFSLEYFLDYYQRNISWIHMRVVMGYEILVENVCDPDLTYLDFNKELKKKLEGGER